MDKMFLKIVFWLVVYVGSIGFLLPILFSAKSTPMVFGGVIISILLLYFPFKYFRSINFKDELNSFLSHFRKNDKYGE